MHNSIKDDVHFFQYIKIKQTHLETVSKKIYIFKKIIICFYLVQICIYQLVKYTY